ncbi:hypothetical protein FQN60_017550, partial [Etheostoma spectabile]
MRILSSHHIGIVIEGVQVLHEMPSVPHSCAMLFGLIHALNLRYPSKLKYTSDEGDGLLGGAEALGPLDSYSNGFSDGNTPVVCKVELKKPVAQEILMIDSSPAATFGDSYLRTMEEQIMVFSMPLSIVHRVVHRMVDEMLAVLPQFVNFPRTQEELQ